MSKIALFTFLAAGALLTGAGKPGLQKTVTLNADSNGHVIKVKIGDEVALELPENPSTGYTWALYDLDEKTLQQSGSTFNQPPQTNPPRVGVGGTRLFTFRVLKRGKAAVKAKLWRQWEGEPSVTKRFAVTIVAR